MSRTNIEWELITDGIQRSLEKAAEAELERDEQKRLSHLRDAARRTKALELYILQEFNA